MLNNRIKFASQVTWHDIEHRVNMISLYFFINVNVNVQDNTNTSAVKF